MTKAKKRVPLTPELKQALKDLPIKEKDKLLNRLVPKDYNLAHQLEYRLVELEETLEERRDDVMEHITSRAQHYPTAYHSPFYLLMDIRDCSGKISFHVTVTRDKYGEIQLNLALLNLLLGNNEQDLQRENYWMIQKLANYTAKRAIKIVKLAMKIHEDLLLDFEDDMQRLGEIIINNRQLAQEAKALGLKTKWLTELDFPEKF